MAYNAVSSQANNYFELARAKSQSYEDQMTRTAQQARDVKAALESKVDDEIKSLNSAEINFQKSEAEFKTQTEALTAQLNTINSSVTTLRLGVGAAGKAIESVAERTPSTATTEQVKIVAESVINSAAIAKNVNFIIFPHYRKSIVESVNFLQTMTAILSSQGFSIAAASSENENSVSDKDGPRVDYFVDTTKSRDETQRIADTAESIASALNVRIPADWKHFVAEKHEDQYAAKQTNFLGVWF